MYDHIYFLQPMSNVFEIFFADVDFDLEILKFIVISLCSSYNPLFQSHVICYY